MHVFHVCPGRAEGTLRVQGAKNSALPILAASLLVRGETVVRNCPRLADVDSAADILRFLGCKVRRAGDAVAVDASDVEARAIPDDMMRRMRSSVIFLGAILARTGQARMTYPGGCELGPRPVDMHLDALRRLGADIDEADGHITARADALRGAEITLRFPSVGATENALIAAAAAQGVTVIRGAAREPEIADLAGFLRRVGCRIRDDGGTLTVEGTGSPAGAAEHRVIADRIAAGTYLCAAAATGGRVTLTDAETGHLEALLGVLREAGCEIQTGRGTVTLWAPERLRAPGTVITRPYPGFPTDLQAPLMAALLRAEGETRMVETIFGSRYRHAAELRKLGADIVCSGREARVRGVGTLRGAAMTATDLRGGAAMLIGALAAQGDSSVAEAAHIDRGYEAPEAAFGQLGIRLYRTNE